MITYKGQEIQVRSGAWDDVMNRCFYDIVDEVYKHYICRDIATGELFALYCYGCTGGKNEAYKK